MKSGMVLQGGCWAFAEGIPNVAFGAVVDVDVLMALVRCCTCRSSNLTVLKCFCQQTTESRKATSDLLLCSYYYLLLPFLEGSIVYIENYQVSLRCFH